jgi:hypothetical protein
MTRNSLIVLILFVAGVGCAHREAVRVDCDGPLREINRAVPTDKDKAAFDSLAGESHDR